MSLRHLPSAADLDIRRMLLASRLSSCAPALALSLLIFPLFGACAADDQRDAASVRADSAKLAIMTRRLDSVAHAHDSDRGRGERRDSTTHLSSRADSISHTITFMSSGQRSFLMANRDGKLLLDFGRVDAKLKTTESQKAFVEAVSALAPIRINERFRVSGPWGSEDAVVTGFTHAGSRVVATLSLPPAIDTLARGKLPLVALATRATEERPAVADSCHRDSSALGDTARVRTVMDSLQQVLRLDIPKLTDRQKKSVRVSTSRVTGCFGGPRLLIFATISAYDYDYVRELAALVDEKGAVIPLRPNDLRFHAHDVLLAFDADGDGIDEVAVRGHARGSGGTTILKLVAQTKRLAYLAGGFAWETF
ncbi:MAG: hypothetical protein ACR2OG_05075 [Gemmatimonadaceae bacterium]